MRVLLVDEKARMLALGVHRVRSDDRAGEIEVLEQRTEGGDLVRLRVDVDLGDRLALLVGHDRDEVHLAALVEASAA